MEIIVLDVDGSYTTCVVCPTCGGLVTVCWEGPVEGVCWEGPVGGACWEGPVGGACWEGPVGGACWEGPAEGASLKGVTPLGVCGLAWVPVPWLVSVP